jgi:hypothetical protein
MRALGWLRRRSELFALGGCDDGGVEGLGGCGYEVVMEDLGVALLESVAYELLRGLDLREADEMQAGLRRDVAPLQMQAERLIEQRGGEVAAGGATLREGLGPCGEDAGVVGGCGGA